MKNLFAFPSKIPILLFIIFLTLVRMFFSEEYLSETEKIDRIYKMLRAERRGRIFKLIIKLALLGLVVYGYYYLSLPEHADVRKNITDTLQAKATEFILPMVGGMVQDLTQSM